MPSVKDIFDTDGIIPAMNSEQNPKNKFWTFKGWLQSTGNRLIRVENMVKAIYKATVEDKK